MTIRVLLVDDQSLVRLGFRAILEQQPDLEVVGEAGDGAQAVSMTRAQRPDVVLMDVRMPGLDGIEATRQVVAEGVSQVLVLTTFDLDEYVYGAMRAGAAGFLLKSVDAPRLVESVRLVAAGDGVLEPGVTRRIMAAFAESGPKPAAPPPGLADLTDREREVLVCLGEGLSNQQIARRLSIGEATVKTHVSRVLGKLDLRSRVQAAMLARDAGVF